MEIAIEPGNLRDYQELLESYRTAILVTVGEGGHLHSRPMATQEQHGDDGIWFATYADSDKVHDILANPRVGLAFHGGEHDSAYLSISGTAEVVRDRAKIRELWEPDWNAWFPDGPEQEDLVLLRVVAEHAEWLRPEGGKLQVLASMTKRVATGSKEPPAPKKELDLR